MKKWFTTNALYIAWTQAVIALLGSLFFSEILKILPCVLCWYQRICIYPLVIIIAVGIIRKSRDLHWYVLPFSIIGLGISFYHNLLYYGIVPETLAPCSAGVSCVTKSIQLWSFVTIPFLSFWAFAIITFCMVLYIKSLKTHQ